MNLLDLVEQNGVTLRRVAMTNGGEYAGACPFCGGKDRFRVWPEQRNGRYWCRGCRKSGDAIQYLRDAHRITYQEACVKLNIEPATQRYSAGPIRKERTTFTPRATTGPGDLWEEEARAFLDMAKRSLKADTGLDARSFLHGKGLSDDTIKSAGLGWNPSDVFLDREAWGLPPEAREDGKPRRLWIPRGLVIPCFANGKVIRLRVRRADPGNGPRYVIVSSSDTRSMSWNLDRKVVVMVESELDGLLIHQEAGDLAGVVALGNAQAKPDPETHEVLRKADLILVALDSDEAGAKASWQFWLQTYGGKVKRWPVIKGKDPSEAWANGLDIRAWVLAGLPGGKVTPPTNHSLAPRLTIPAPDGLAILEMTLKQLHESQSSIKIRSGVLGREVWFIPRESYAAKIPAGEVNYTAAELAHLMKLNPGPRELQEIAMIKKTFSGARILKTEGRRHAIDPE